MAQINELFGWFCQCAYAISFNQPNTSSRRTEHAVVRNISIGHYTQNRRTIPIPCIPIGFLAVAGPPNEKNEQVVVRSIRICTQIHLFSYWVSTEQEQVVFSKNSNSHSVLSYWVSCCDTRAGGWLVVEKRNQTTRGQKSPKIVIPFRVFRLGF
jgi:hypothetical protein